MIDPTILFEDLMIEAVAWKKRQDLRGPMIKTN